MQTYDEKNVFARILRGETPCEKVYEDDFSLAFWDISPRAPVHVLLIPKGPYASAVDFYANASDDLIVGFSRAVKHVIELLDMGKKGCRLIINHGPHGSQEVPHFHMHFLGGCALGPLVSLPKGFQKTG